MWKFAEFFKSANELHWGSGWYQWFLYAGILLILVYEKKKTTRDILGILPLVFILAIYNPLFFYCMELIFKKATVLYYARLFTFIPLIYSISAGVMQILKKTSKGLKFILVCGIIAVIAASGNNFYYADWMKPAQNIQKAPNDALKIAGLLPKDQGNICVAFPDPLNIYMRQIDSSLIMPYGRNMDELGNVLSRPIDNVDYVMALSGRRDVDYIVVAKTEDNHRAFMDKGFIQSAETENYLVYKVSTPIVQEREFNDKRQIISKTLYQNGVPINNSYGYSTTEHVYDDWGNCIKQTYRNSEGIICEDAVGYASVVKGYNLSGNVNSEKYYDREGRPMVVNGRYETRFNYNIKGRVRCETYFDDNGRAMPRTDTLYAKKSMEYNGGGLLTKEWYADENNKAVLSSEGYAGFENVYDEYNRLIEKRYFDALGQPIDISFGFARYHRVYAETGGIVTEDFYNKAGEKMDIGSILEMNQHTIPELEGTQYPSWDAGVHYVWNSDGSCTVSGESRGNSWCTFTDGAKPFYIFAGRDYYIRYSSEKVILRLYCYSDYEMQKLIGEVATLEDTVISIPSNCCAVTMRFWVGPGDAVDETVMPLIQLL